MDKAHAASPAAKESAEPVRIRSDRSAVQFLQQNQAVAATLDASTVFVHPDYLGSRAVLSHEFAHVAQLRSGLHSSRGAAESAADSYAAGKSGAVGGAAAPPLFQLATATAPLTADTPFLPSPQQQGEAEQRDIAQLGTQTPGIDTKIETATGKTMDPAGSGIEYHVHVSGSGAKGTVDSSTDVIVHADREQRFATRAIGPGVGPPTGIALNIEGIPVPVSPAPSDHPPIYPIVLGYRRVLHFTDRDGRTCDVRIMSTVKFTYDTWARELGGRPQTFETLMSMHGDEGLTDVQLDGKSAIQPYHATSFNEGKSIDIQTMLTLGGFQVGSALLEGTSAPADFVRADRTAGEQFASLEAFLAALDAKEIARRVELERARREELGWFGRLLEDTGAGEAIEEAAEAIDSFFGGIAEAVAEFWDSLPPSVRGVLEALGEAVVAVAVILGLAAIVVALSPVELTIGAVALVIGGLFLAYAFVSSLISRAEEAADIGLYDPFVIVGVALMDAIGLSAIIEAITDQSIISGKDLRRTEEERYKSGTSGLINLVMLALGVREFKGKGAVDIDPLGGRETLLDPGPKPPEPLFEGGIGEGELDEGNFTSEDVTGSKGKKRIGGKKVPEKPFDTETKRRLDRDVIRRRPGESAADALARVFRVLGQKISDTPLRQHWDAAKAEVLGNRPESSLTDAEMLDSYESIRDKFWDRVRADPAAVDYLRDANIEFEPGSRAPMIQVNDPNVPWFERKINLDHLQEKALNPRRAIDPANLAFESQGGNVNRENIQQRHPELR